MHDNTSLSDEAKVGLVDEAIQLSYKLGKKMESREEKGSVKIWELDSNYNSDAYYSDSSPETLTNHQTHRDLLEYYSCTVAQLHFLLYVFFTQSL